MLESHCQSRNVIKLLKNPRASGNSGRTIALAIHSSNFMNIGLILNWYSFLKFWCDSDRIWYSFLKCDLQMNKSDLLFIQPTKNCDLQMNKCDLLLKNSDVLLIKANLFFKNINFFKIFPIFIKQITTQSDRGTRSHVSGLKFSCSRIYMFLI